MTLPKHRLFVEALQAGPLILPSELAHYAGNVLRLTVGDEVTLLGDGRAAVARVTSLDPMTVDVTAPWDAPGLDCSLTVAVATPKGDRADWLVEKLSELGASRIVWLKTQRTVVVPKEGSNKNERWQRVAEAAARQAGRATPPTIEGPVAVSALADLEGNARFIGDASGVPLGTTGIPSSAVLAIGPEGGFTPDELLQAQKSGYTAVRFAPYTLRVETAAVAGAAVILSNASPAGVASKS